MCGGATVLLVLLGSGVSTGGVSLPQVAADARLAVLGPRDGRPEAARAALERIVGLENEIARRWNDRPGGPGFHLLALSLAHAAAAETSLDGVVPPGTLEDLRRVRRGCHTPVVSDAPLFSGPAFLSDLREHRPLLFEAFERVPQTRAVFVAALSCASRTVVFDPTETTLAPGQYRARGGIAYIRLSSRLRPEAAGPFLSVPIFEAFNTHNAPAVAALKDDAAAGRVDRDDYVRAEAALELLTAAHLLGVLRRHFRELTDAGFAGEPPDWQVNLFRLCVPPPPTWHVPTRVWYPHVAYGTAYDRLRISAQAEPDGDLWEASVLLDRVWFHGQILEGDRERLLEMGRRLTRIEVADPWCVLHRHLPRPVRVWLSTVRGGESVAKVCRAVWRGRRGAVAAWF